MQKRDAPDKPNPQPLPYKGRGVRIKASLKSRREVRVIDVNLEKVGLEDLD
jgi:hypothetical protein